MYSHRVSTSRLSSRKSSIESSAHPHLPSSFGSNAASRRANASQRSATCRADSSRGPHEPLTSNFSSRSMSDHAHSRPAAGGLAHVDHVDSDVVFLEGSLDRVRDSRVPHAPLDRCSVRSLFLALRLVDQPLQPGWPLAALARLSEPLLPGALLVKEVGVLRFGIDEFADTEAVELDGFRARNIDLVLEFANRTCLLLLEAPRILAAAGAVDPDPATRPTIGLAHPRNPKDLPGGTTTCRAATGSAATTGRRCEHGGGVLGQPQSAVGRHGAPDHGDRGARGDGGSAAKAPDTGRAEGPTAGGDTFAHLHQPDPGGHLDPMAEGRADLLGVLAGPIGHAVPRVAEGEVAVDLDTAERVAATERVAG